MGVDRLRGSAAALWLSILMGSASAEPASPEWPDAAMLSGIVQPLVPISAFDRAAINRVGNGAFLASPWVAPPLGEPDSVIDRMLVEALERAHRRVVTGDLHLASNADTPNMADLDSGWDVLASADSGDRNRRLRQAASLLPSQEANGSWEDAQSTELAAAVPIAGPGNETSMLRSLRNAFISMKDGTFFTRERVILIAAGLLTIGLLSHLRSTRR